MSDLLLFLVLKTMQVGLLKLSLAYFTDPTHGLLLFFFGSMMLLAV
jgi:hypothetical protein